MTVVEYIKSSVREGTQVSRVNIYTLAGLGATAHFFFHFLFKYVFHLPYESFVLRFICVVLLTLVLFKLKYPGFLGNYFTAYWHGMLIFVLPFIFTVYLLKNDFHELWLYWEIFMIFILIAFVPNWLMFLFDLLVGVFFAILYYLITSPGVRLHPDFDIPLYSIVVFFTILAGYIFSYGNKKGQIALEKNSALQALAGSIAHEMRNPLGQVRYNLEAIEQNLPGYHPGRLSSPISGESLDRLYKYVSNGVLAVKRGSQIITMILDEVRERPVDKSGFHYVSAAVVTQQAIDEYGFESREEREKVVFEKNGDFVLRVGETMYVFVLFNLIMNALYFLKPYADAKISITLEKDSPFNKVKVRDDGPGIPPENIDKLFTPYFTAHKKGGTGLGLSYCKRIMRAFGGDITCDSRLGEYTEFILLFPVVSDEEIEKNFKGFLAENRPLFEGKRVLVVDDEPSDRAVVRETLAGLNVMVDEAGNGKEALEKLSGGRYDLVVMNLAMPVMNGYDAVEKTRKGEAGAENAMVPIVAYTSSPYYAVHGKVKKSGMQGVITKTGLQSEFVRRLARIVRDFHRHSLQDLQGKSLLIADDSAFNRVALKTVLEKQKMLIDEAVDGADALEKLEHGSYDLVLMDIRMPRADGIEATRRIRQSPDSSLSSLPVIGLSADSDDGLIEEALHAGMNEYLVKPVDTNVLLMKIMQLTC